MLLPPAWGSSPCPPVSVCGTGAWRAIAAFLGTRPACFATLVRSASRLRPMPGGFTPGGLLRLPRSFRPRAMPCACVPAFLPPCSTGISTCRPSATHRCLALGPDLPRADQLYPGNLGYSAKRIPTSFSLLIPAFSLPSPPPPLPVRLRRAGDAPLPAHFRAPQGFGGVFQPRTFSARGLSASELLRTLSMHGCF